MLYYIPDQNSFYKVHILTKAPFIPDQNSFYSKSTLYITILFYYYIVYERNLDFLNLEIWFSTHSFGLRRYAHA